MAQLANNIKRGPVANVIALHDFNSAHVDVRGWFNYVVDWFRENGLEPIRIGVTGGFYKGNKTITFRNGLKRLEEHNYEEVVAISLYATPPNHDTDMFDGIFMAQYDADDRGVMVLTWDDRIAPFKPEYCQQLAKDTSSFLSPRYGYGFQRPFRQGPSFYPFGIIAGNDLSDEEEDQIAKWANEYLTSGADYKTNDLRDIYPLNILSEAHLKRTVNGHPFKDWIEATPQWGNLEQITETLWTWWVEPEHIAAVRAALAPSGMILCL